MRRTEVKRSQADREALITVSNLSVADAGNVHTDAGMGMCLCRCGTQHHAGRLLEMDRLSLALRDRGLFATVSSTVCRFYLKRVVP